MSIFVPKAGHVIFSGNSWVVEGLKGVPSHASAGCLHWVVVSISARSIASGLILNLEALASELIPVVALSKASS